MILTLDVENTVVKRNGKMHLDPFEPQNTLVMVGMLDDHMNETIVTFDHAEQQPTTDGRRMVQDALDAAHLLVAHNAPHDLLWLWESGFTYDGEVFDTMLGEYVLQRGQKQPLSLEACAERYELETKKQDTLKEYFKDGYSTRDIPHAELAEYLSHDLHATQQLYNVLQTSYEGCKSLIPTIQLTNQLCIHLARIYQRGFQVDMDALMEVRDEFVQERNVLMVALEEQACDLMGDRPAVSPTTRRCGQTCSMNVCLIVSTEVTLRRTVRSCTNKKHISAVHVRVAVRCGNKRRMVHHMLEVINVVIAVAQDILLLTFIVTLLG